MSKESSKFPKLSAIFNEKTANGTHLIGQDITFTLDDVKKAFVVTGHERPSSISNFVLDLTRKDKGIRSRLPHQIIDLGYDLRKKTGKVPGSKKINYCGEFVYTGKDTYGNTKPLHDWLEWHAPTKIIDIEHSIPNVVLSYLAKDEGSIFSVIDYCDVLSAVIFDTPQQIFRVQNPMKWQPNAIDGFYASHDTVEGTTTVYPVESKAISTKDEINLVQMYGQYQTFIDKMKAARMEQAKVRPVAIKMIRSGLQISVMEFNPYYDAVKNKSAPYFTVSGCFEVRLIPAIPSWQK